MSRGVANTRMRDLYDLYVLRKAKADCINASVLRRAFSGTCAKRNTTADSTEIDLVFEEVRASATMEERWNSYAARFEYASNLAWSDVLDVAGRLLNTATTR